VNKLKERWGVDSNWQLIAIFVVFAITGSTASFIGKPILAFLNISPETFTTLGYWIVRILLLFIMYQCLLVCFGWLFGQFKFFWTFEKKMIRRLGLKRFVD
jgi:hypothetical protein